MRIKSQKGITLMVLVITIVVMLIIAGASASVLFDGEGLLKTSEESKRLQENYANSEETKTNDLINDVNNIMSGANKEPEQKEYLFEYTGAVQEWTAPTSGVWKLEVWGAQGGESVYDKYKWLGGLGGYSSGNIYLNKDTILYVNVGQKGNAATDSGAEATFGNGGAGGANSQYHNLGGSGGGATDIRTKTDSLYTRLIVAGGGGGAGYGTQSSLIASPEYSGGAGGGLTGGIGTYYSNYQKRMGLAGTQVSGGSGGSGGSTASGNAGTYGIGANGTNGAAGGAGGRRWLVWRRLWSRWG